MFQFQQGDKTVMRMRAMVTTNKGLLRCFCLFVLLAATTYTCKAVAEPSLLLPQESVSMKNCGLGQTSYWTMYLHNLPPGDYDVVEGYYPAWCVDPNHVMKSNTDYYPVDLYSSYDANMPAHFSDPDWDKVNYIINNKQGTVADIQQAIWHFVDGVGGTPYTGSDPDTLAMITGANTYGQGFEPDRGQLIAVLCDAGEERQNTFIEVNRPVPEASTLLLFGSGLSSLLVFARKKGLIRL
jgi:hypothetical protein